MSTKDHIYKVILLATFFSFEFVTTTQQELYQKKHLQKNIEVLQVLETYEQEIKLLVPWFQVGACTLIIFNNSMQIVSQVRKKK